MIEAVAFDTHRFAQQLAEGGFTDGQAETLAAQLVDLFGSNLVTKVDIVRVEAGLESMRKETSARIEGLQRETSARIETLQRETSTRIETLQRETSTRIETLQRETKADIARVEAGVEKFRQETKADIARLAAGMDALRQETSAKIEAAKTDLVKWMCIALIAQTGLLVTFIKLL